MIYSINPFGPNVDKIIKCLGNWKLTVTIQDSNPAINYMLSFNVWLEHPSIGHRKVVSDFNRRNGKIDADMSVLCTMATIDGNKGCEEIFKLLTDKRLTFEEKYAALFDIQWMQDNPVGRVINEKGEVVDTYYDV